MEGVVTKISKPKFPKFHGYGVVHLNILNSNINYYDPRGKKEQYLLIIKNQIAEFYGYVAMNVGDTIFIDFPNINISYYSSELERDVEYKLDIYNKSFYEEIKEENLQEI